LPNVVVDATPEAQEPLLRPADERCNVIVVVRLGARLREVVVADTTTVLVDHHGIDGVPRELVRFHHNEAVVLRRDDFGSFDGRIP
jgi:hypothetical protein